MPAMPYRVFKDRASACGLLADEVESLIRRRAAEGRRAVLGLATGSTPIPFYEELVKRHREEGLSFENVLTFNLDEYLGLPPEHPESYHTFMRRHLFSHIDIAPENCHIPDGGVSPGDAAAHSAAYESLIARAGGIDLQVLGIGGNGHIGFNEPGSPIGSRTHLTELAAKTRQDAAPAFGGLENVPTRAVTMGCGTILASRRIVLMAWGKAKAGIVARALEGPVTEALPASYLQTHPAASFYLDQDAASACCEKPLA